MPPWQGCAALGAVALLDLSQPYFPVYDTPYRDFALDLTLLMKVIAGLISLYVYWTIPRSPKPRTSTQGQKTATTSSDDQSSALRKNLWKAFFGAQSGVASGSARSARKSDRTRVTDRQRSKSPDATPAVSMDATPVVSLQVDSKMFMVSGSPNGSPNLNRHGRTLSAVGSVNKPMTISEQRQPILR